MSHSQKHAIFIKHFKSEFKQIYVDFQRLKTLCFTRVCFTKKKTFYIHTYKKTTETTNNMKHTAIYIYGFSANESDCDTVANYKCSKIFI